MSGPGSADRADGRHEYTRFAPLFVELATLSEDNPLRRTLRDRLVRAHLQLAHNIARRYGRRGEPLADLEQVATVGLIHAVDRFDPHRESDFLQFAVPTITGEIRRYFRDHAWATRVPRRLKELHLAISAATGPLSQQLGRAPTPRELAAHLDRPLEEIFEGLNAAYAYRSRSLDSMIDNGATPAAARLGRYDAELQLLEDRETLAPLLAELPPRERTIIILRFFRYQTQTQIAHQLGISQMHVSRLLSRTLVLLRQKLEAG